MTEKNEQENDNTGKLVLPEQVAPTTLYLLPMVGRPFFPAQVLPIVINSEAWQQTLNAVAESAHQQLGLVLVKTAVAEQATPDDFYSFGCSVRVHNPVFEKSQTQFIAEGLQRFRITKWLQRKPPFLVQVEYFDIEKELDDVSQELKAYSMSLIESIKELTVLNPMYGEELRTFLSRNNANDPGYLADFTAAITSSQGEDLQEILETIPLKKRMEKVLLLIKKETEIAKIQAKIRKRVDERMNEQQRKFFLKEMLREIQKELGIRKDDKAVDIEKIEQKLKQLNIPEHAMQVINSELQKLSVLETGSPEYAVTRNYLNYLTDLPWGIYSEDNFDLAVARAVLDKNHDGLEDVKTRIYEFLAVASYRKRAGGSILLLVGPPGVGKTSIGKSVAKALNRTFFRFSVGGMRDEAEIKGHRKTYIGAMPGKFIQAIKSCGTANPVIMLDEIDKMTSHYHGDPGSALLEVLDPEQNDEFLDHYLDVRFDLSRVLFICTANQLDTIPGPLLDRMEIIHLSGYLVEEKIKIAKHHLWPAQLAKAGLKANQVKLTDSVLRNLIDSYARDAGVRTLDKLLSKIARKLVVKILDGQTTPIKISIDDLSDYLGQAYFRKKKIMAGVGIATGMAWTSMGGVLLPVEAIRVHGHRRGFQLTGKLGSVMQESAQIALSYINSKAAEFDFDPLYFEKNYVHLHVPEGATPKDGPSAGITMATALLSLVKNKKVNSALAMTGELTLTGQVLAVGGIQEKVIAAKRNKRKRIILPAENQGQYEELPEFIRQGLEIYFVNDFTEVYQVIFEKK